MNRAHMALGFAASVWACVLGGAMRAQAPVRAAAPKPAQTPGPARFGIGRDATAAEIAAWDIDIMPDGTGLPP